MQRRSASSMRMRPRLRSKCLTLWLRGLGVAVLAGAVCAAQVVSPPTCPATHPAAHPTMAAIQATAEAGAADPSVMVAAEPIENFGIVRYRVQDYADCVGSGGCYWADMDAQAKRAEAMLDRLAATKKAGEKLALVLDIDETSLSSYCEMKKEDFGFISQMFDGWVASPEDSMVLPGTLRLFNRARARGIEVFFITGRAEKFRAATVRGLETAGYKGWKGLSLRDAAQEHVSTVAYKSEERKKITAAGYRIVMSVGDQWSDLNGEPKAEISVKLPNPFYYLP
jgi:acid phosphatase